MNWPFHRPTIFRPETRFSKAPQTFCFSKTPKTFRTRKAIFSSSVSKNGVYTAETSCMQGISVHIKNLWMNSSVIVRFEILLWLYGPEKFPGLSRDGPWPDGFRPLWRSVWENSARSRNQSDCKIWIPSAYEPGSRAWLLPFQGATVRLIF